MPMTYRTKKNDSFLPEFYFSRGMGQKLNLGLTVILVLGTAFLISVGTIPGVVITPFQMVLVLLLSILSLWAGLAADQVVRIRLNATLGISAILWALLLGVLHEAASVRLVQESSDPGSTASFVFGVIGIYFLVTSYVANKKAE